MEHFCIAEAFRDLIYRTLSRSVLPLSFVTPRSRSASATTRTISQGLTLVNSSSSSLTLQFSNSTASKLKIAGQNLLYSKIVTAGKISKVSNAAKNLVTIGFSAVSNKTSLFDTAFNALQRSEEHTSELQSHSF